MENLICNSLTSLGLQDFNKYISGDNENPFKEYLEGSNYYKTDENDTAETAFKTLNDYCKAQGATDKEVTYWDGQVREMMESVKKIRETLPQRLGVDDVFYFCNEEKKDEKIPRTEEDLKASIAEIEKMDAVLKLKANEERKAKLSRIQAEEESKDILAKLPNFVNSTGFKNNFQEFLKLLNDAESSETGSTLLQQKKDQDEGRTEKEEKKEKLNQQKVEDLKFVERNIRLAKCGRGTLSLTDEEKSRLDDLLENVKIPLKTLKDIKESEESDDELSEDESYGIDAESKAILEQIDQKLELLRQKTYRPSYNISFLEKHKLEKKTSDEGDKQNKSEGKKREKSPDRLDKINKLLNLMKSVSKEEITPLTDNEMADLVQQLKEDEDKESEEESPKTEVVNTPYSAPPQDVIADLVSDAKLLMPKFKYRFDNS